MPNWCSTTYAFKGKGLEAFKTKFNEVMDKLVENNDHSCYIFLEDLLDAYGYDKDSPARQNSFSRGWITYYQDNGSWLTVDTEDAWGPQTDAFDIILADYPDVDYVFIAEEPGCEVFLNTDLTGEYFDDKYYVEYIRDESYDVERFPTIEKANDWLMYRAEVDDINKLVEGEDYYIYEYEQA